MGREEEAIESYNEVFPLLEGEPRCARVDWERHSLFVNIGNSYSRSGDYETARSEALNYTSAYMKYEISKC